MTSINQPNQNKNISESFEPSGSRIGRTYEEVWKERAIRITKEPRNRITMYSPEDNPNSHIAEAAITGIHEKSTLNQLYFSSQNVQNIQNMIRYSIYKTSQQKYVIGNQDPLELHIIMRSLYLQYSRNNYTDVTGQIQRLNEIVVEEITPKILSSIQQYLKYLKDRSKPFYGNNPIDHPVNVNSSGLKSLRIDTAIGF